jgi:putative flippase GtrA
MSVYLAGLSTITPFTAGFINGFTYNCCLNWNHRTSNNSNQLIEHPILATLGASLAGFVIGYGADIVSSLIPRNFHPVFIGILLGTSIIYVSRNFMYKKIN